MKVVLTPSSCSLASSAVTGLILPLTSESRLENDREREHPRNEQNLIAQQLIVVAAHALKQQQQKEVAH